MNEHLTECFCGSPIEWITTAIGICGKSHLIVWNPSDAVYPYIFSLGDSRIQESVATALRAERAAREAAERECERLRRVIEGTPEARWTPGDLKDGQRFTFSSMNLGVCLRRFLEGWSIQMPRKHRGQGCYADCLTAELVCRWLNVRGAVEVKA